MVGVGSAGTCQDLMITVTVLPSKLIHKCNKSAIDISSWIKGAINISIFFAGCQFVSSYQS